jgi:hypothetical protein
MVGNGRSYRDIMDTLGIPQRSFYQYLSQEFEHDRPQLVQQNIDNLALEIRFLHDRLTSAYRRLVLIASNENVSAKERINAGTAAYEVAVSIAKLAFEGPIIMKDFVAYLR